MRAWRTDGDGHRVTAPRGGAATGRGSARSAGARPGVRGLPHRPARHRRRPAAAPSPGRARSRGRGRRGRAWAPTVRDLAVGDRVGIAWLRQTCGTCRWCRRGAENLCLASRYTGWDEDGGLRRVRRRPAAYAYRLPGGVSDVQLAPLLCAGIIGYRALRRAQVPPGGRLGIYGFGASAHLTAQVALAQGAEVHVLTRDAAARTARPGARGGLGGRGRRTNRRCRWTPRSCSPLPASSCRSPWPRSSRGARSPWPASTSATFRGWTTSGTCSGSGRSPASRRTPEPTARSCWCWRDGIGVRATVTPYPFERAADALDDLSQDKVSGVAVLVMDPI